MAVVRTTRTGFLGNLFNSILAVPIGILLFLASFAVLFWNEGRTNLANVAVESVVAAAQDASGHEGEFVSVTGTLSSDERVGDPQFLMDGPWLELRRVVEQYQWVEHSESETRDKVGGGTETTTTYTYELEWSTTWHDSSRFEDTSYTNVPMRYDSESFSVSSASVGLWTFSAPTAQLPSGRELALSGDDDVKLIGDGARGVVQGNYVYLDGARPGDPGVGDHRVSFRALGQGDTVTMFGEAGGGALTPYNYEGSKTWLRALRGDRDTAIQALQTEHTVMTWILRLVGFLMMWFGMGMVFAPLHAVAGILPFLKKGSRFMVNLITFPIALILTVITIVVSMILHSIVALIIVGLIVAGGAFWLIKNRDKDAGATPAAATAGVPPGPPPGSPPGPPPG